VDEPRRKPRLPLLSRHRRRPLEPAAADHEPPRRASKRRRHLLSSSDALLRAVGGCFSGERLVGARCVASGVNARRRSGWAGPIRRAFFLFSSISFFVNFEILGEIKNTQIGKFYFEKLFRLELVQFKICSISNFKFKFENMFNFEFV
jgi:hypothetical protein